MSKPLQRKAWMKRSPKPKRKEPLRTVTFATLDERGWTFPKRKAMRKVSKKRAKENREYSKRRVVFLREHPFCQVREEPCTDIATEIHHRDGREGSLLNLEREWFAVCRKCHEHIHQHPGIARANGFLK